MYCLLKASHKEHKQLVGKEVVTLKEGQFIWGRNESTNELNHGAKPSERKSSSTWERLLKLLEELEMLNRITNNKYTVINIVNWRVYQGYNKNIEQGNEPIMNRKRTDSEPKVNTNNNVNNANNVNKKDSRKQVYDETSLYYKMTDYFYKLILKNNPQHKKPNYQKWSDDFRKLVELDKRDKDQVRKVMEFVQSDDFEMNNVLSPNKLRQRYDQLFMKTNQSKRNNFVKPRYEVVEGGKSNDKHTEKGGNVQLFR